MKLIRPLKWRIVIGLMASEVIGRGQGRPGGARRGRGSLEACENGLEAAEDVLEAVDTAEAGEAPLIR